MNRPEIQAVIFDRDGVLTYFDTVAAGDFYQTLLPISIFELAAEWQGWGLEVGFPSTMEEEREFFVRFWNHIADRLGRDRV